MSKIGLFLDVDQTLTVGCIQEEYAKLLGVEVDFRQIEDQLDKGEITSEEFGKALIDLFNKNGFDLGFAEQHYDDIKRNSWTPHLLNLPDVTTYLVSLGPSYYVHKFAKQYNIPSEHVLCSEYIFDGGGKNAKLSYCKAISGPGKGEYTEKHRSKHIINIGVGDSVEFDAQFLSVCDVAILTRRHPHYLYAENLERIAGLVGRLANRLHLVEASQRRTKPAVFIGSSSEAKGRAEAVLTNIANGGIKVEPRIWPHTFDASDTNIESLENSLQDFDFAVFLMTPDDLVISRGKKKFAARDNLILELGLFIGRLGRNRCFIIRPDGPDPDLPSDLDGMSHLKYVADNNDIRSALIPATRVILERVSRLGCFT